MMLQLRYVLLTLLATSILASCDNSSDTAGKESVPKVTASKEKSEEFSRQIATSIDKRDPSMVDSTLDMEAFFYAITADMNPGEDGLKGFLSAVPPGLGLGSQLVKVMGENGSFRLVRFNWNDGHPKALYRIITLEGALNYYEFHLGERKDSRLSIRDVYVYLNGEMFTETMRRILTSDKRSPIFRLLAPEMVEGKGMMKAIDSMSKLVKSGEYQAAMNYYDAIPEAARKEKALQLQRMQAAQQLGDTVYAQVLEDMSRQFAGDPSMDLLMIDHYVMKRQFDSALTAVDRLDRAIGGDPYLNLLRANVAAEKNEIAPAKDYIQKVISYDSTLTAPYFALTALTLLEENHAETAKVLDLIENRMGVTFDPNDLAQDPDYAAFARSAEFRAWAAERQ